MCGHCLRFASTPVRAQVTTQRSGSRVALGSRLTGERRLLFDMMLLSGSAALRRRSASRRAPRRSRGDLGGRASAACSGSAGDRASRPARARERAAEDLHRLDRDVRARASAPCRVSRMCTTRRSLVDRSRAHEPLALHPVDDAGHRAVLRADALGQRREREVAERLEQLDDRELRAREARPRGPCPS